MITRHPWGGLADPALQPPADLSILGLPYDGSACWRGGASEAPRRLREISSCSPAISEEGYVVEPGSLRVIDAGDVAPETSGVLADAARRSYFEQVERAVSGIFDQAGSKPFLLSIGGDHAISIPLLGGFSKAFPGGYGLIWLDAHPDLFDAYEGSPLSNACPVRRALESGGLDPRHLLILGTRSYNAAELDFMRERKVRFVPAREIDRIGIPAAVAMASERMDGVGNLYMSIDIDVADPACAPGTGTPVAGGLSSRQLLDLSRGLLQALPVRAMDIVEIAPRLDPTDATLFLALQIVFESFAVLAQKGDHRGGH